MLMQRAVKVRPMLFRVKKGNFTMSKFRVSKRFQARDTRIPQYIVLALTVSETFYPVVSSLHVEALGTGECGL
jgi:hypothetical protein